ncbi:MULTISPECIES: hypothetical protein [Serratia]|nr:MULTISPECIES: hypothetical protein [Serratia]MBC3253550.1 hypothetical protein [Serratia fonticola]UAN65936.1 hypothetical protein KGP16_27270 [Serratia sp. JSRIV006]
MSEQQYKQILKARLIDLPELKIKDVAAVLATRPAWLREIASRCLMKAA